MHVASYLTGKSLSDIYAQAQEFAEREADREENPYPSYNKNQMTVRKDLIFPNENDAERWIDEHDRGCGIPITLFAFMTMHLRQKK